MFNSHLQINVIRSPVGDHYLFSPLSSVLTSYPWTPKTAIAWTGLEESRFWDLSRPKEHVTNPNVALLRLTRSAEGNSATYAATAASNNNGEQGNGADSCEKDGSEYKEWREEQEGDNNNNSDKMTTQHSPHGLDYILEQNTAQKESIPSTNYSTTYGLTNSYGFNQNASSSPPKSSSLLLPTPDTTLLSDGSDEMEVDEANLEDYMYSANRVRELYARSYPNINLPPINHGDNIYSFERSDSGPSTVSPAPSPTIPSLKSVLGDFMPQNDSSFSGDGSDAYVSPSDSDSNYSPGSAHSSPEARHAEPARSDNLYQRGTVPKKKGPKPLPHTYTSHSVSFGSPPEHIHGYSCVAELKERGLWEEAQKRKRGKLTCSECGKFKAVSEKYDHLADLAKHMDKTHGDLSHRLKCPHADCAWGVIGFVSLTEQKRHIKHLHESQPIECTVCFRKLQRQDGYIRHMRDVHGQTVPKTPKQSRKKK